MASEYRVSLPNGQKIKMLYNKNDPEGKKINQVRQLLQQYIIQDQTYNSEAKKIRENPELSKEDLNEKMNILRQKRAKNNLYSYCNDYWIWLDSFDFLKKNYEDKTKTLLDRLANFILLGHFREGMINTDYALSEKNRREIPASAAHSYVQDMIFGFDSDDSSFGARNSNIDTIFTNDLLSSNLYDIDDTGNIIHRKKSKGKKKRKSYKQTKEYKLDSLFIREEMVKNILVKLLNEECYDRETIEKLTKEMTEDEKNKWVKKPYKNIHNENLYVYKKHTIKGNQGLIDKDKPYIWEWCYVNTHNEFECRESTYKIHESVEQYKIKSDNQCLMDKVLMIAQCEKVYKPCVLKNGIEYSKPTLELDKDRTYFFDMNNDRIEKSLISKIE